MKRNVKNAICVVLIILSCVMVFLTMNYAKNNVKESNNFSNNPPEMPSGGNGPDQGGEMTPPDMNDDEERKEPGDKPDMNENQNEDMQDDESNIPEMDNDNNRPEMPNNNMQMPRQNTNTASSKKIGTTYYIVFAVEALVISSLAIYLVMSNLNKRNIKETFENKDKIIIYILGTLLGTGVLTYSFGAITTNYFLNSSNTTEKGNGNSNIEYASKNEIKETKTVENEEYSSSEKDENALLIDGDITVDLNNITVEKTGSSDGGDNTSFYGTNSAIIAKNGAKVSIKNSTITTDATGANGVFSYGGSATTNNSSNDGTTIEISDSKITTSQDNSGGIMTTGGGTMIANNLEITTSGTSSAAIRTDRGGGTVTVNKGTYKTTGKGSPSIYSTADITVNDATLIATASEGIVIEGKNKVTINNCDLTDTNNELNGQSTAYKNIFIYQSMSGDAATGEALFNATDSKITTNKGDTFYITNTTATITLTNNEIKNNDSTGAFLRAQKDYWGNSGSNGGDVTLIMNNQKSFGDIIIDSISTLTMTMKESSYYEGTINSDNNAKSIILNLDATSSIKLTGNSYITELNNEVSNNSNIDFNGYKLYVNGTAIN
mgnify:CR=1 FL=1